MVHSTEYGSINISSKMDNEKIKIETLTRKLVAGYLNEKGETNALQINESPDVRSNDFQQLKTFLEIKTKGNFLQNFDSFYLVLSSLFSSIRCSLIISNTQ